MLKLTQLICLILICLPLSVGPALAIPPGVESKLVQEVDLGPNGTGKTYEVTNKVCYDRDKLVVHSIDSGLTVAQLLAPENPGETAFLLLNEEDTEREVWVSQASDPFTFCLRYYGKRILDVPA